MRLLTKLTRCLFYVRGYHISLIGSESSFILLFAFSISNPLSYWQWTKDIANIAIKVAQLTEITNTIVAPSFHNHSHRFLFHFSSITISLFSYWILFLFSLPLRLEVANIVSLQSKLTKSNRFQPKLSWYCIATVGIGCFWINQYHESFS